MRGNLCEDGKQARLLRDTFDTASVHGKSRVMNERIRNPSERKAAVIGFAALSRVSR